MSTTSSKLRKVASTICWTILALSVGLFVAGFFALKVIKVPPGPSLIYAMFTTHWLATMAACVVAIRWSASSTPRRFWLGLVLSLLAMISSYWGLTAIHITRTQTVNGRFQCLFDSRWFFTASAALATLAFAFTLWKIWRSRHVA